MQFLTFFSVKHIRDDRDNITIQPTQRSAAKQAVLSRQALMSKLNASKTDHRQQLTAT